MDKGHEYAIQKTEKRGGGEERRQREANKDMETW